jgi:hypothetical protein
MPNDLTLRNRKPDFYDQVVMNALRPIVGDWGYSKTLDCLGYLAAEMMESAKTDKDEQGETEYMALALRLFTLSEKTEN